MTASLAHQQRKHGGTREVSIRPTTVAWLGAAILVVALLLGADPTVTVVALLAVGVVLVGLRDPWWLVTALMLFITVVPVEFTDNTLLGHSIGNPFQVVMPAAVLLLLLRSLKLRALPRMMLADVLMLMLALWGMASLMNAGRMPVDSYWKQYFNKQLYPMGLYLAVRMLPSERGKLLRLIRVCTVFVALESVAMILQARAGSSVIYPTHEGRATGAFGFFWTAATYMVMWPPVFVYLSAASKSTWGRTAWILALVANAYAVTRTSQRAATALLPITVGFCLVAPTLRRTTVLVLAAGALLYIPWSRSGAGSSLLNRFSETDESRAAYRAIGMEMLRSPKWHPAFGVGPYQAQGEMTSMAMGERGDAEFLMWGSKKRRLADIAESGTALHNVFIAILVEFGLVGAGTALALVGLAVRSAVRTARAPAADRGLLTAIVAALIAWAGRAAYHNVYKYTAPMCLMFFWYAVLVGHPRIFGPDSGSDLPPRNPTSRSERIV